MLQAHKNGVAEPSAKLCLPRVALAVALVSNSDTKVLVEGLPGSLTESECVAALRAIPAVISVSLVPDATTVEAPNGAAAGAQDSVEAEDGPKNGTQGTKSRPGAGATPEHRSAVLEVATAAAVQPLVSHLEMIKVGGCELRARLLLEPSETEAAVQALIDAHENQMRGGNDSVDVVGQADNGNNSTPENGLAPTDGMPPGVLRLVNALRSDEVEGQREGIIHDLRCVAARYGDVVDVELPVAPSSADTSADNKESAAQNAAKSVAADEEATHTDQKATAGQLQDIIVKYKSLQSAARAARALEGRLFAQRPLSVVVDSY